MSAPQTNVEKQQRNHKGPLIGMVVVVIAVISGFVWWIGAETSDANLAPGAQSPLDTSQGAPDQ